MNKPVLVVGGLLVLWIIVRVIQHKILEKEAAALRAANDQRQKEYRDLVAQKEQEIADAKLTFDINKRKLTDSDPK